MTTPDETLCPCGSTKDYDSCCKPYLEGGKPAPTAEALMRSRYSAFALGNAAYIAHSWHPDTAPHELHLEASPSWCALEILTTEEGGENDRKGMVEFKAHYMNGGKSVAIHEVSRFVKEKGRWYYVDGDIMTNDATKAPKTGRNEPCPCGSGKKFKKCCMA